MTSMEASATDVVEEVEVRGHIIDSLILPRVLDAITQAGGTFALRDLSVGQRQHDPSRAVLDVRADSHSRLRRILRRIAEHGAVPAHATNVSLSVADQDGAFPEGFYSTTNQQTHIRLQQRWIDVSDQEMDCGIVVDVQRQTARCVPMSDVHEGMLVVMGRSGVKVVPWSRSVRGSAFQFMNSDVSTEKPKDLAVQQIARQMFDVRARGGRVAVVGGPAIVHTGSTEHLSRLVHCGFVDLLLAGNALATHDIERSQFHTSLGVDLQSGAPVERGHEHHLRAINRIRRCGGIASAVESGALTSGILYECVVHQVPYLLAGSIRDDGPLPEVVTDVLDAQRQMRGLLREIDFCLMIATMLHSVAVGNLLPAHVPVVCVDINPSTVIKLSDRGSLQTAGLVTDVEPFLRSLVLQLSTMEGEDLSCCPGEWREPSDSQTQSLRERRDEH